MIIIILTKIQINLFIIIRYQLQLKINGNIFLEILIFLIVIDKVGDDLLVPFTDSKNMQSLSGVPIKSIENNYNNIAVERGFETTVNLSPHQYFLQNSYNIMNLL